ncbi:MAG: acylphosphatase [Candidatus Marsarchaeota archaeon]|nr:acylphosphatase [Candidatus Marsarchaeota archaeon]
MRTFLVVHGIVQGVGYRAFVRYKANQLLIKGFVRNAPDGSVEVLAESEDSSKVRRFIEEIKVDNGNIQVFGIDVDEKKLEKHKGEYFSSFTVKND